MLHDILSKKTSLGLLSTNENLVIKESSKGSLIANGSLIIIKIFT